MKLKRLGRTGLKVSEICPPRLKDPVVALR
jgi:hypothetical protein